VETIAWSRLIWINEPPSSTVEGDDLVVSTARESDFWQRTSYGFVRATGHALGVPLVGDAAIEVRFRADFEAQFDQAGLMLWAGPELWLKAGAELSDGQLYASAVVTVGMSDWSVAPLPDAAVRATLAFRASRSGDAVTVRYRIGAEPEWRFLRLAYLPPEARLVAGPMCCSPSREGFSVRFEPVRVGPPDAALHAE
jgi:regulation of enolase protein 1 (concanavalin A-like superfamily)